MPPTIQTNGRPDGRSKASTSERRSELVCRVKYGNTLPDIPFDPKFIVYPFEAQRYVQYNPTSLESNYKFELLTEHDLGVTIDLINPDAYRLDPNAYLEPEDEYLLDDESNAPVDAKRSRHQGKNVSWLRRTEYISTEYNRFVQSAQKAEARVGYSIKKQLKEEVLYKDRDSQIKAIQETFDHAKQPISQHYSKPGVTAVEVLPLFPDFEMWKQPCAQVIFDTDPAQKDKSVTEQNEEMSKAMIRGMVDEHGEQFVAYFLPTSETLEKQKRDVEMGVEYEEGEEYDYFLAGEYNWNVKNKASRGYEENYFFVVKDDGIYYNELETRVRLSKRRKIGTVGGRAKSRLLVHHRPMTEQELAAQDARVMMLEPPGEEEEELDNRMMSNTRAHDDEDRRSEASSTTSSRGRKRRASSSPARDDSDQEQGSDQEQHSQAGSPPAHRGSDNESEAGSPNPRRGSDNENDGSEAGSQASPRGSDNENGGESEAGSPARAEDDEEGSHQGSPAHSPTGSEDRHSGDEGLGNFDEEPAGSPAGSGSAARSGSGSPARSGSGSPARSARSGSPAKSPARSGSGSPARSAGSGSPARSGSGSPARSGSGSPARSPGGGSAYGDYVSEAGSPRNDENDDNDDDDDEDDDDRRNEEAEIFGSDSD